MSIVKVSTPGTCNGRDIKTRYFVQLDMCLNGTTMRHWIHSRHPVISGELIGGHCPCFGDICLNNIWIFIQLNMRLSNMHIEFVAFIFSCTRVWFVQTIMWTNSGIFLIWSLGNEPQWNFNHNSCIFIQENPIETSSAKWRPFCRGVSVLSMFNSDAQWLSIAHKRPKSWTKLTFFVSVSAMIWNVNTYRHVQLGRREAQRNTLFSTYPISCQRCPQQKMLDGSLSNPD